MEIVIIYILGALIVGWIASNSTLGFGSGFLISLLLSPIIGFIICLLYPNKNKVVHNTNVHSNTSAADELLKLKSLLDSGAITTMEYDTQKKKLLS